MRKPAPRQANRVAVATLSQARGCYTSRARLPLLGGASLRRPLIALLSLRTHRCVSSVGTGNFAIYVGCSTQRWTGAVNSCFSGARQG